MKKIALSLLVILAGFTSPSLTAQIVTDVVVLAAPPNPGQNGSYFQTVSRQDAKYWQLPAPGNAKVWMRPPTGPVTALPNGRIDGTILNQSGTYEFYVFVEGLSFLHTVRVE